MRDLIKSLFHKCKFETIKIEKIGNYTIWKQKCSCEKKREVIFDSNNCYGILNLF